ncbi:SLC13 family permease [Oenococcus sicerae]|uniref:Di- and tricarboxylate transporter n=1 Tax=Oenococcus sicerae TaxID=2203724 RepID=A0AAJ1RB59_9LACO|nr:SLC13 family permease [Oenococcus sicerae]MDN6901096.1 di- and tricarboxylate transporter [Oenococcus sicerae]
MKFIRQVFLDKIFLCSFLVAICTLTLGFPQQRDIDWQTIESLFTLMLAVQIFQFLGVFARISEFLTKYVKMARNLVELFVFMAFFSSMILTNDVVLLTLIPILAMILTRSCINHVYPVVLICLSANLGSSLLPLGNPQNLFLFTFYHLSFQTFLEMGLPVCFISLILLCVACYKVSKIRIRIPSFALQTIPISQLSISILASIAALAGILRFISLSAAMIVTILSAFLISPKIFKHVDYSLLLTFICFFVAVSDIKHLPILSHVLKMLNTSQRGVYLSSLGLSQLLSNVPTAVLWAPFSPHYYAIFLGTNIGGLGTIIASLANLLAYKQYRINFPEEHTSYLKTFAFFNLLFLLILGTLGFFLIQ